MPGNTPTKKAAGNSRPRHLRRAITPAETRLWNDLRSRRLGGLKFRRQHPVGRYVVDFCCPEHAPVVELDGDVHASLETKDRIRTRAIEDRGCFVIRFTNEEVLTSLDVVLAEIHRCACRRTAASGE